MKRKPVLFITFLLIATIYSDIFAQDNTEGGLPESAIARLGKGGINIIRFSPDGTRLVVGTDIGVWIYDVPDGKETVLLTKDTGRINALAFSIDGKILASGGSDNPIIQLWDIDKVNELTTITVTGSEDTVKALAFHDNRLIGVDTFGRLIRLDMNTNEKISRINELFIPSTAVAFSKKGHICATGNPDGKIYLRDTTSGKTHATLDVQDDLRVPNELVQVPNELVEVKPRKSETRQISALAFSPDAKILASGSVDKIVRLWDPDKQINLGKLVGHTGWITAIAVSEDGKTLASGDADKIIKLWDIDTKQERATLRGHTSGINALTFSPDGKTLASGSYDGTIWYWNYNTGKEIANLTSDHIEWVKAVAFSKDGSTLTSASFNGTVDVWSLKTKQELITFTAAQSDMADILVLSPNGRLVANLGSIGMMALNPYRIGENERLLELRRNKHIHFWDIVTGEEILTFRLDAKSGGISVAFSSDGKTMAIAPGNFQEIHLWNTNMGQKLFILNTKGNYPKRKLVFSPDGSLLATYGNFIQTQVWDVTTQREITPFTTGSDWTDTLAFSHDNAILATKQHFGIVLSKVTPTTIEEHNIIHYDKILPIGDVLLFSPDDDYLLAPQFENGAYTIQIWDVQTGSSFKTVSAHTEPIDTLSFSPDGKTLASGSQDGTVLLWDWYKIVVHSVPGKIQKFTWKYDPEMVKNWLKKHNYQFKKEEGRYFLRDADGNDGSTTADGMGRTGIGDVLVTHYGSGYFRFIIRRIGTGNFIFDEDGNLQSIDPLDFETDH